MVNDSNKSLMNSKNLFDVKSISNSVQRFARYRIGALISIGRFCIDWQSLTEKNESPIDKNYDAKAKKAKSLNNNNMNLH